ncbi:protein STRUBBELIG-RECEPTOR FAMILY 3-like isoform X2 [Phoenix dactylifera]|uniref:Protein STRUBBELIG-RECEPTOR FAMILY 3-like isoform X2 n=1 Tax=Phoenix dactylifera TaxID=42345 RepID=A0A8B9A4V6_PHODC|nr:protein STRUBBELIG-RECEPTOR FAMILY 3-like isoform X2 [Phoenix dactylifera]
MLFAWIANIGLRISACLGAGLMVIVIMPFSQAYTNERDVYAINSLYAALGSPPLPGWFSNGGDPCVEAWQGVQCMDSNITGIVLNGANLGGQLGDGLGNFTSILTIDLSNNNIGGGIPENLPVTMQRFFLSANQFTGSIPSSLSKLTLLTDMSVNNNHLTGELPDAFQSLTGLINFDLSFNNLTGQLPSSMGSLSSLTTLHVQNNQLSGTLDVLADLPLKDLNIENNLFSGPVPVKLLSIPNFKEDGNPFNTSISPSSMVPQPSSPLSKAPPAPGTMPANSSDGPSAQQSAPPGKKKHLSTMRVIGYVLIAVVLFIVVVLMVIFCMSKYQERKSKHGELYKSQVGRVSKGSKEPRSKGHLIMPKDEAKEVAKEVPEERKKEPEMDTRITVPEETSAKQKEHVIEMGGTSILVMPPPPVEKVIVNPIASAENIARSPPPEKICPPTSAISFSVASLQQYTDSFTEERLIRDSRLGKVYLAELPDGKLLEVMKIDNVNSRIPVDVFLELVANISELRHPNIVELVGYCAEFGQRLLVYKYFSRKTLHDILHCGDDLNRKLSWNARLQVALGAAKALEYLHEGCEPPIAHQNFEPANVLIDDELAVRVSECGLASLVSSISVTQLSGRMRALYSYEAPEINEAGSCTDRSDVYSFGVVMLELLTGRKPFDSSRPRIEQHLVRWASSQLHDINTLSRMVDPSIGGKYSEKSLSRFADIISRCIQQGPEFRPPMSEVVQDLTRMGKYAKAASDRDLQRR